MAKVNINNCYFVLISRVREMRKMDQSIFFGAKKVKFTIVENMHNVGSYKDIFSNETYKMGISDFDNPGTLFINDQWHVLPLRTLININGQYLRKATLEQIFKEPIIELNRLFYSEERNKIMDMNYIYELINNSNSVGDKQKKLSIRRIKK